MQNKISFGMIVKNASQDLKEILPLMKTIADEMIVVDTGSTDDTAAVAASLGARVIDHVWQDSFSAARNVYVAAASGDWVFSIDADERLAERDLELIRQAANKPPQGFLMTTRNYGAQPNTEGYRACSGEYPELEQGQTGWFPSTKVRMFPRLKGVGYDGEIRELVEPSLERQGLKLGEILAPIHHFEQVYAHKKEYYRRLLEKKSLSRPDDPRAAIELATEAYHLGDYQAALTAAERAIKIARGGKRGHYFDLGSAYNLLAACQLKQGQKKAAIKSFDQGIAAGGPYVETLKKNRRSLLKQSGLSLGAIMIVKNEESNLGKILGDIREVVDEIVVVDTGSTDRAVAIAESFGARLGHFKWCDDFAAARNHAIGLATSDYLIWFDADDRLDAANQDRLRALKAKLAPQRDTVYMLKLMNQINEEDQDAFPTVSYQARLFPRTPGLLFEGRIHEQILPAAYRLKLKTESADTLITHTGYHGQQERLEKGKRNLALLLEELKDGKDDAQQHYFIAATYFALNEYDDCLEHLAIAKNLDREASWYKYSFALTTDCHLRRHDSAAAIAELRQALEEFPESGLFRYYLGALLIKDGQYAEAVTVLEECARLGIEIETFPVAPDAQEKVPYCYGVALEKLGRLSEAAQAYRASIKVNPQAYSARSALGLLLLAQGDQTGSLEQLELAKQSVPGYDHSLWLALAKLYGLSGQNAKAFELFSEAFDKTPGDAYVAANLAQASILVDDVDTLVAALDALMRRAGLDPDREIDSIEQFGALCAECGALLLAQNQAAAAEILGHCSLLLDEHNATAHLLLGDVLAAKGERNPAMEHWKQALLNGTEPKAVEERLNRL